MKSALFIVVILFYLVPVNSFGQDWSITKHLQGSNFSLTGSDIYETIQLDSVISLGTDSVFFMNRDVLYPFDTIGYITYFKYPYSNFLSQAIVKKSDGVYLFQTNLNRCAVFTNLPVGSNWLSDTLNTINASVTRAFVQVIYGQADSVKSIVFSNGDSIQISKAHSIVGSSDLFGTGSFLTQVGNENTGDGLLVPTFNSVFDYLVGDIFEYHEYSGSHFPGPSIFTKHAVTGSVNLGDTIICYTNFKQKKYIFMYYDLIDSVFSVGSDTLIFTKNNYKELLADPMQPIKNGSTCANFFKPAHVGYDPVFNTQFKEIEPTPYLDHLPYLPMSVDSVFSYFNPYICNDFENKRYGKGVGLIEHSSQTYTFSPYPYYYHNYLLGFSKSGDTLGQIHADGFFNGIHEVDSEINFMIYPNPTNGQTTIQLELPYTGNCTLFGMDGKTIIQNYVNQQSKIELNLQGFSTGVYYIKLGSSIEKIVLY